MRARGCRRVSADEASMNESEKECCEMPAQTNMAFLAFLGHITRRLGIPVEIDASGWLNSPAIELRYALGVDRGIEPRLLRVAGDANVVGLLALDVRRQCDRYNVALRELRALRRRFEALIQRTPIEPTVEAAYQHLSKLDDTIARRQAQRMGHGAVMLATLDDEIAFWERYHEYFAKIVTRGERAHRAILPDVAGDDGSPLDVERGARSASPGSPCLEVGMVGMVGIRGRRQRRQRV